MKRSLGLVLLFLSGIAIGGMVIGVAVSRSYQKLYADQYVIGIRDQANVALSIRAGRQKVLADRIEASLPSYVIAIHDNFGGNENATDSLWMIKAYYERNNRPVPAEISPILTALPPQPPTSCQLRLKALDQKAQAKPGSQK